MDKKHPDVAHAEWMLGWACGYHAYLDGKKSPWRGSNASDRRVRDEQHFKCGYKEGYAYAERYGHRSVEVQRDPNWEDI